MKRSELYALVWSKPMVHAAKELGISDVGLAKACKRNAIPAPPRGHWNKVQAGKSSPQISLPKAEVDPEVEFATVDPAQREQDQRTSKARREAIAARVETLRSEAFAPGPTREQVHPLVKATATYSEKIPRLVARYQRMSPMERLSSTYERPPVDDNGRWHIDAPNGMVMTVSSSSIDWALDLHDRAFKALTRVGAKVVRTPRSDREASTIACVLRGEKITLHFKEGYRRHRVDEEELARLRAKHGWANQYRYEPAGRFTWTIAGAERSLAKQWVGSREQIEAKLDEIVATCLDFLELQPGKRKERLEEEARRRQESAREDALRRVAASRKDQLKKAFVAAEQLDRVEALKRFLNVIETDLPNYREPYGERARVWLSVVREELASANPYEKILSECLTVPTWGTWPPDWWPIGLAGGEAPRDNPA